MFRVLCVCCLAASASLVVGCNKTTPPGVGQVAAKKTTSETQAAVAPAVAYDPLVSPDQMIELPVQPHWKPRRSPKFDTVYMGDPGDVYYVRRVRKTFPSLTDIDAIRDHYREVTRKENGGILSVEVTKVQGHDAIVYYSKQTVKGIRGYRYVARCVIPNGDEWFEVRMDAIQMGTTGGRETMATLLLSKQGKLESEPVPPNAPRTPGSGPAKPGATRIKGFFFDPYDAAFNDGAINSVADDPKYDETLPKHPLSRVRWLFPKLLENITLNFEAAVPQKG